MAVKSKKAITLRDVFFLVHPQSRPYRPTQEQIDLWTKLVENNLAVPKTWEVGLSAAKNQAQRKSMWEDLLRSNKLGGMACLRNLRNMLKDNVDYRLIEERLEKGIKKALPFRFIAAASHAPQMKAAIEKSMLKAVEQNDSLGGHTLLVIDVSGSMCWNISSRSKMNRIDAACGLAILAREICDRLTIYATGSCTVPISTAHRGFDLANAITHSDAGVSGIYMKACMSAIKNFEMGVEFDRVIILTDEQDCDRGDPSFAVKLGKHNVVVNVSSHQYGTSYSNGWEHIDGWSERIFDYIREMEKTGAQVQA